MPKIAVIIGAEVGIGRATAIEFARNGDDVVLLSRHPARLQALNKSARKGYSTAQAIAGNEVAHGLLDHFLAIKGSSGQLSAMPLLHDTPINPFEPVPGKATAHGRFDGQAKSRRCEFFPDRRRDALMPGFACAAVVLAGSFIKHRGR